MLKVVRRDGQVCGACQRNVSDDEMEFDHVIPHSSGGAATAAGSGRSARGAKGSESGDRAALSRAQA
jgi:5-methylcytosine-specific restriction endonuclease McrA